MSQQLRNVISKNGLSFGDTSTGVDWCVKALHPSDPLTEVRGVPDRSAIPTLCMNYQTTSTLTIAPGFTTPWSFDLTLLPHPLYFAYWDGVHATDPATGAIGEGNFVNSQLAPLGTSVPNLVAVWQGLAKRWRLCYQSVTVLQDGPDLANQGTLAVSQSTFEPRLNFVSRIDASGPGGAIWSAYPLAYWDQATEGPSFERSQAMPNAMLGRSKDGAYVPLKLTDTCQVWQSERDFIVPTGPGTVVDALRTGFRVVSSILTPAYPFPAVMPFHGNYGAVEGQVIPGLMNGNVAHISARNLSDQTSFTFQFRVGIEIQLDPSSTLTPQLKLSPPYDPRALDTYFAIARELKDAYPADYNCSGKLGEAIKNALAMIAPPLLGLIPGGRALVPLVGPALEGASMVTQAVRQRRKTRKQKQRARQAALTLSEWASTPESAIAREMRDKAEAAMAKQLATELSQASVERARNQRPPNSNRTVQIASLPRRVRPARVRRGTT